METQAMKFKSLGSDDKKFLASFRPAKKKSLYRDSDINKLKQNDKKGISVFIVDDDIMYLTAMEHFLSQEIPSVKIQTFQTGEDALIQMKISSPEIVILDYFLDSQNPTAKNGIEILKNIYKINPNVRVIVLSKQDDIKVALVCIRLGASDYLSKNEKSFFKIKNILSGIVEDTSLIGKIKKRVTIFKVLNVIFILMLVLFYLLGRV